MITKIIPIGEKIPYNYQIDNYTPLTFGDYNIVAGGIINKIEGLFKYKLIDIVNGKVIERMVLTDHILDLSHKASLNYGIFPLYSNMLNSPSIKGFGYYEGQANAIYLDYVNYIKSLVSKTPDSAISLQEFHIQSYIDILELALEYYQISDDAMRYCNNEKIYLTGLVNKYKNVLYKVGINSTLAMVHLMYQLTDANGFAEEDFERLAENRTLYFGNMEDFNTFEQVDIFKNNKLNPFTLQIMGSGKNPILSRGISIAHYIDYSCRIIEKSNNVTYSPPFKLDDNVMFSFPKDTRLAFNTIISYLTNNGYMPSVVRLYDGNLEIVDQSLRTSHINNDKFMQKELLEHIELLDMSNINNIEMMLTNEEDIYLTYDYNGVRQKMYIDMFNLTLVNFNSILSCNRIV